MQALDQFDRAAYEMVTGAAAREAFDLRREDPSTRERYGLHRWGQSCLLARRLVESGVTFVTVNFDPHSFSYDQHANIRQGMLSAGPRMDSAIMSLVEDMYQRGLDRQVLLIVWGEFGRTPMINASAGRDHWGQVMSVLVSGGGLRMGKSSARRTTREKCRRTALSRHTTSWPRCTGTWASIRRRRSPISRAARSRY